MAPSPDQFPGLYGRDAVYDLHKLVAERAQPAWPFRPEFEIGEPLGHGNTSTTFATFDEYQYLAQTAGSEPAEQLTHLSDRVVRLGIVSEPRNEDRGLYTWGTGPTTLENIHVGSAALFGQVGERLQAVQSFVNQCPSLLMPKVYGSVLVEDEASDAVYLTTLVERIYGTVVARPRIPVLNYDLTHATADPTDIYKVNFVQTAQEICDTVAANVGKKLPYDLLFWHQYMFGRTASQGLGVYASDIFSETSIITPLDTVIAAMMLEQAQKFSGDIRYDELHSLYDS